MFSILKKMADKQGLEYGVSNSAAWVSFCLSGLLHFNYEDGCLSCDCQANVAGPGFHKTAVDFTEELIKKAGLAVSIDDETEYAEHHDFERINVCC